jgi:hypothetical protein
MIGIVHDDPDVTPSKELRYDAAVTVNRPVSPKGEFGVQELPAPLKPRAAREPGRGPAEELDLSVVSRVL